MEITKEQLIIQGCINMESIAQRNLYHTFMPIMRTVCNRYASNSEDAQDIMQEGFVKVFLNFNKFENKGALEGWIKRIMINTAITHYKKNKAWREKESLDNYEKYSSDDENARIEFANEAENDNVWDRYADLDSEVLLQTIQSLAEPFRMVFNMFFVEDMKHKEIAEVLQIDENTSRTRLVRAKKMVQKKLELLVHSTSLK